MSSAPQVLPSRVFVGRQRELAGLRAALDDARTGRGRLVLLVGEAGIGKTRTAEELAASARAAGLPTIWGRCWEGAGAPALWPWTQVIRGCLDADPSLERLLAATGAADLLLHPDRPAPPMLDPAAVAEPARRFALFDAVATFVRRASERTPLVVVLDDLHWADAASLLMLRFVARCLVECRALVIGTHRDAGAGDGRAELLAALARHGDRLVLGGLLPADVERFVEGVTGIRPSPAVVEAVHARTDGNPFFLAELLGGLDSAGRLESTTLPPGVAQVIRGRLAGLPRECRGALAAAAVAGREFELGLLGEPRAVADALGPAVAARIVRPPPAGAAAWRFVHALVRETAYEELPATERARLHLAVAEAIERVHARRLDGELASLAHHYAEAAALVGPAPALDYATRAAERARALLAYEEAATHYAAALRFVGDDDRRRLALLLALADVEMPAGRRSAARRHYLEAAALARAVGDRDALAHVALGYAGRGDLTTGPDATLTGLLEEALGALGPDDGPLRARLMSRLADALLFVPEARARRDVLTREATAMAERLGEVRTLGVALLARRIAIWDPDHLDERLGVTRRMIALGISGRDAELELGGRFWQIVDLLEAGDIGGVDEAIAAYSRLAGMLRQPLYLWQVPSLRAMRAVLAGRFDDAERLIEEARREGERAESPNVAFRSAVHRFALRRAQGRLGELEPLLRAAVERFPRIVALRVSLALACAECGRDVEARGELERLAADDFACLPRDGSWLAAMCHLSEVAARLGDGTRAGVLYERLLPYADRIAVVSLAHGCEGAVATFLGMLAGSLGRFADAERHFAHGLDRNTALGSPPLAAATEAARTAMRRLSAPPAGRPARATEHVFRREGEVWMLCFDGTVSRLKDAKGLRYVAELIRQAGREVHVADLAGVDHRALLVGTACDAERPDAHARAAYRARLERAREEIEAAERANDVVRAGALRAEVERIAAELAGAYGLGRGRRAARDPLEKVRKAVTNRIRDALVRIRQADPALGRHLDRSIRTGVLCVYRPEEPARWRL